MNLQQLLTFCRVLSEGSMTAAAEKLRLTQPAVSQQIRSLEDELGVPLLVRGVRNVKPSMQGQVLYDYAKKILHLTQQAEAAIHTLSQEISGEIRLGTTNAFGLYLISPVVGLFLKHNTQLSLKLIYGTAEQVVGEMRKGALDMAILPNLKKEFGVDFDRYEEQFLMSDEMWLVGSSRDAGLPTKITMAEINGRSLVVDGAAYPGFKKMFQQKAEQGKLTIRPVFESDNVGTLKRVVESGVGWGFLPSHSIKKQVRTRRLNHIHVEDLNYQTTVHLYSARTPGVKKVAEVFFRAIQQQAVLET
jgi:LysR family transcriptional regulator, transcriptional activator of the cysJI operon